MSRYIDEQRGRFGVEPSCEVLDVSASAYYHRAKAAPASDPSRGRDLTQRAFEVVNSRNSFSVTAAPSIGASDVAA